MIFLSHQHEDKDFVSFFAQNLKKMYGEENIFFDDWSIKPGENIIERMSEGLEECKFFFFFITENSLHSEMVKLEWTTAIKEKSQKDIKFIPIRAEDVSVPLIISTLKYLDLFNNGVDVTLSQMRDIIEDDIKGEEYPTFNNLQAFVLQKDKDTIEFYVNTKRFFEPNCKFMILTELNNDEASFTFGGDGMTFTNFLPNAVATKQGKKLNGFYLAKEGGIQKGFRTKMVFKKKIEQGVGLDFVHVVSESKFNYIECKVISSVSELPNL